MAFYVPGTQKSPLSNPYSAKKYGREKCIEMYTEYIKAKPELLQTFLDGIYTELGCWCSPNACHGDVLRKLWLEHNC